MSSGQPEQPAIPKKVVYVCSSCSADIEVGLINGLLPAQMQCPNCQRVYPLPVTQTQPKSSEEWTPEKVENLIKLVDTLAAKYLTYKKDEADAGHRELRTLTKYNSILTGILSIFLAAIVGLMSYLALGKIVSGDALLFLVGTITGYILLFIQRLTKGILGGKKEEEEEQ